MKNILTVCVFLFFAFLYASLQDVDASEIKVQVCVYAFDLLYLNGEVRLGADEEIINQRFLSALFLSSKITLYVC